MNQDATTTLAPGHSSLPPSYESDDDMVRFMMAEFWRRNECARLAEELQDESS